MLEFPEKWAPSNQGMLFNYTADFGPNWQKFCEAKDKALATIRSSELGQRLLTEIEAAKCCAQVVSCKADNKCSLTSTSDADNACYREVISNESLRAKLLVLLDGAKDVNADLQTVVRKLNRIQGEGTVLRKDDGWSIRELKLTALDRGKIAYWLMDHLTPGPGAACIVRWVHDMEDVSSNFSEGTAPAWTKRPPWIALVHELIHAWRQVTGRVVFHPTTPEYHEEAMTVGLLPYDRCVFSENRFRERGGQAPRGFYGPTTQQKSEKAALKYATK
jgi:hypothetical protein